MDERTQQRLGYITVIGFCVFAKCGRCGVTESYTAPMMTDADMDIKRTWKHTEKYGWTCPYCAKRRS